MTLNDFCWERSMFYIRQYSQLPSTFHFHFVLSHECQSLLVLHSNNRNIFVPFPMNTYWGIKVSPSNYANRAIKKVILACGWRSKLARAPYVLIRHANGIYENMAQGWTRYNLQFVADFLECEIIGLAANYTVDSMVVVKWHVIKSLMRNLFFVLERSRLFKKHKKFSERSLNGALIYFTEFHKISTVDCECKHHSDVKYDLSLNLISERIILVYSTSSIS